MNLAPEDLRQDKHDKRRASLLSLEPILRQRWLVLGWQLLTLNALSHFLALRHATVPEICSFDVRAAMERSSKQYAHDHNGSVISSEDSVEEEEKVQLLGSSSVFLRRSNSRIPPFCYLIALLILVANAILLSILLQVVLSRTPEAKVQKSWLPPESM